MENKYYYFSIVAKLPLNIDLSSICAYPVVCPPEDEQSTGRPGVVPDGGGGGGGRGGNPHNGTEEIAEEIELGTDTEKGQGDEQRNGEIVKATTQGNGERDILFANGTTNRYDRRGSLIGRLDQEGNIKNVEVAGVGAYVSNVAGPSKGFYKGAWKSAMFHFGTKHAHWHLLYIAKSKQWGHNSNLGSIIRKSSHRAQSVHCILCILKYFYSGDGRQVVQDIVPRHGEAPQCVSHQMRLGTIDPRQRQMFLVHCASWGDATSDEQGTTSGLGNGGMDLENAGRSGIYIREGGSNLDVHSAENAGVPEQQQVSRYNPRARGRGGHFGPKLNAEGVILQLVEQRAFNEGNASDILCVNDDWFTFVFEPRASEKIKIAVNIARMLVFRETAGKRLERAMDYERRRNPESAEPEHINELIVKLKSLIEENDIDWDEFCRVTHDHFHRRMGKRNNLFFIGPPSSGKTMIMESLVECHYNFGRLTGLTSSSSFNFSSLLNMNACLMDECKLTDNQFEQWKLLAAGSPMATDVKYKERHDVKNCVLYTCANFEIGMYVDVPEKDRAIDSRTTTFRFRKIIDYKIYLNPYVWDSMWKQFE